MSDLEQARRLLGMARKDLAALSAMHDREAFAEEIFGFHAQQAAEKALKAWVAWLGREYPFRHDLGELLALLEREGQDAGAYREVVDLTDFGVRLRYEAVDEDEEPLDREAVRSLLTALVRQVEGLLSAA